METQTITVNWPVLLAYVLSAAAPTITGFLQQFSKNFEAKAPWWAKGLVTAALGALMTAVASYIADADASVAAGAVIATIGSMNIAFRKGSRDHLMMLRQARVEAALLAEAEKKAEEQAAVK